MKRIPLLLAAALLSACGETPTQPKGTDPAVEPSFDAIPISAGCTEFDNNVSWDGLYSGVGLVDSWEFYAGEVLSFSAGFPVQPGYGAPQSLTLYKDSPEPSESWSTTFPGTLTYVIPADGLYRFEWAVNNGVNSTWTVSCGLNINTAPVANDDAASTDEDTPVDIDVLANDTDVNGDPLTVTLATAPPNGSVKLNPDGSVTYTPDPGFYGSDSFTYTANDGLEDSNLATVSITVNRVIPVSIAIKPGGGVPAAINSRSNGLVPVAILGDPAEFALTDIDWTTLAFGPGRATAAHDLSDPATWAAHVTDVNGDGIPDLVTHYSQKDAGLAPGDTEACLTGMISGVSVKACGPVTVR